MPGMGALVRDLRVAGVRCWGLTNWSRRCAGAFGRRFPELDELLDGLLVSGVEGVKKPDEAVFRLAERRFGLALERTAFFDDNALNVDAAVRAGWRARPFVDTVRARAALLDMGVRLAGGDDAGCGWCHRSRAA